MYQRYQRNSCPKALWGERVGNYNLKWLHGQVKETLLEGARHWPMPQPCGEQVCIPWHPQKYNIIQKTKYTFFSVCFSWPKYFPRHGPSSDKRYCMWTSRIWSSAPLTQSIGVFGGGDDFWGFLQSCGGWASWRRFRIARGDDVKGSWKGMSIRAQWSSREARTPPMCMNSWDRRIWGGLSANKVRIRKVSERLGRNMQYMVTQQGTARNSWELLVGLRERVRHKSRLKWVDRQTRRLI